MGKLEYDFIKVQRANLAPHQVCRWEYFAGPLLIFREADVAHYIHKWMRENQSAITFGNNLITTQFLIPLRRNQISSKL